MNPDEEMQIIGILPESSIRETTSPYELEKILYDALCIGPMLEPLMAELRANGRVDGSNANSEITA